MMPSPPGRLLSCQEACPSARVGSPPAETFRTVSPTSSQFRLETFPILQQAYLDSSSGNYFQYNQVTLVNNAQLLDQYNACRLDLEVKGYNQDELAESFAFLLFETEDQAKAVCEEGLKVGSSGITTLGDPLKGVYLCKYSDFLHPKPWYHGKCGFIVIFKIIKGRVKSMIENYTADLTEPSVGYNCHVSINSDTVSSITSHFQAFELTQYYLYEFGHCDVLQRPRQIYPYAIVAFQYSDSKYIMADSAKTELLIPEIQVEYYPWKGQLANKGKVISVALKSNGSPLMPVVLPTKLEIEYVMSIGELKSKLPQGVFEREKYKFKEVRLEGLYCSWYELVADTEGGEAVWLDPLINELEEKKLVVVKRLNDQGLLILFSESVSNPTSGGSQAIHDTLQALFIFNTPRISHLKETNRVMRTLVQNRITPLLPGYTFAVTTGLTSTDTPSIPWNKVVEDQLVEYFKLTSKQSKRRGVATGHHSPVSVGTGPKKGEPPIPGDSWGTRISQLSPYFANPTNYLLPVSRVLKLKGNALKLCQNSGAKPKVLCQSRASEPQPPNAGSPRVTRVSRSKKVQGKHGLPVGLPTPRVPSQFGITVKATSQNQANGQPGKTVGRGNSVSKPIAGSKVSNRAKRKAAKPLQVLASIDCTVSNNAASVPSASPGYSTRSARNNKRSRAQSAKGLSTESPAPPEVNTKRPKPAAAPPQTSAAGRADSNCVDTGTTVLDKVPSQYTETVCVTGINTQQVSRYGVCTWNIVGNVSDNEPASLQPLSLCAGLGLLQEKKALEANRQPSQEGVDNKVGQTDALNILADLAINSAIAAVATPKQHCTLTLHQASGTCAAAARSPVGCSEQLNRYSNLLDHHSDGVPNTELRAQNIMSRAAESHHGGGGEFPESWVAPSSSSSSLEGPPCAAPASSKLEASKVPKSQSRVAKESAHRSSATPRSSHPLGDHSYSRPPKDREPVCSAVANPVSSESESGVYQPISKQGQNESRDSAVSGTSHISQSPTDLGSKDEERTLVGRVLPFRREDSCWTNDTNTVSAPLKSNGALGRSDQVTDCTIADSSQSKFDEDFQCSRHVHEEKDTVKVTFEWKGPYLYQWDSKYTNDSLEKSVNRALHGPWDPAIQETMKEVKLILHMWIGLFYTKSSEMLQTSIRQVQERYGTLEPAAGDLHTELTAVGQPAFSGSESAISETQQKAEVIISSVIKRIEKKSNLVTSCDGETLPCATSQPDEEHPLGDESASSNDNIQSPEELGCTGGLQDSAHISSGQECEQEPTNNLHAAGLEQENQEPNLSLKLTSLTDERNMTDLVQYKDVQDAVDGSLAERNLVDSNQADNRENASVIKQTDNTQQHGLDDSEAMESESPLPQPSTCTVSVVEKPRSVDNVDNPELESTEVEIIRQSSVIKEMLDIQLPAKEPAQSTESLNLRNASASSNCEKVDNHSENRLQTEQLDNLASSEDVENTTSTEDLGAIKDTVANERSMPQDTFNGVDHIDTASPLTIDVPSHTRTLNSTESCNVIIPNNDQTVDTSHPMHNTSGPSVKESTCTYLESCASDYLFQDVTETQRKRGIRRLVSDGEITSDSDPECLGNVKPRSPSDELRRQLKPQVIFNQNCACNLKAQQKQELVWSKDFIAPSERYDGPTESAFTLRDFSEGSDIKIPLVAREFSGSKKVSRITCNVSSQKIKRKRNAHRETSDDGDSEDGDFRVNWNSQSGLLRMQNVDVNHSPDVLVEEMSDSDTPVPLTVKIPDLFGRPKVYRNFTVTAETRWKSDQPTRRRWITRTCCDWQRERIATHPTGKCDWNANHCGNTGSIEKIFNLEYINFSRDLKSVVNRATAGPFTGHVSSSRDGNRTALRKRSIQMVSRGRLTGRRNPLTVTISCRNVDQCNGRHSPNKTWTPCWTNRGDETLQRETDAFSRPKCYTSFMNSRKRPCSQPHVVVRNSVERADRMPRKSCCTREKGSPLADELLNTKWKEYKELQGDGRKRSDPFLCLITELCSDLHQNLSEVVKESWKGTFKFYVFETNSDPFFKEIKECLKNEGHVEIGLLDLSVIQPHHCGKVLVIIRNEDISGHLHQIPHLVELKQMPCVQFAGVDNAEDIKDQTFQELFSSGGFVVSDGTVLNNVTPECLQQISSVLEQLSAERAWKWMIHFKELKKLKEMAREDHTAKRKISLLTRKITENLVEVLPFHACDSRSKEKPDYLSCLVKLQIQKISSRFAVFLTGKPENQDVFAQSGILVTDVNHFTKSLRMLTTPTQDSLATENALVVEGGHFSEIHLEPSYGKNKVTQNLQMPSTLF